MSCVSFRPLFLCGIVHGFHKEYVVSFTSIHGCYSIWIYAFEDSTYVENYDYVYEMFYWYICTRLPIMYSLRPYL